jgi:hypothetical protein
MIGLSFSSVSKHHILSLLTEENNDNPIIIPQHIMFTDEDDNPIIIPPHIVFADEDEVVVVVVHQ